MEEKKKELNSFYTCKHCGKRLIQRQSNGVFKFQYGRNPKYSTSPYPPVEMYIFGSVKMRCINNKCSKMNAFNFFPGNEAWGEDIRQSLREQILETKSPEDNKT